MSNPYGYTPKRPKHGSGGMRKLTAQDREHVYQWWLCGEFTLRQIARAYGISTTYARTIVLIAMDKGAN